MKAPSNEWIAAKKKECGRLRSVTIQGDTYVYRMLKRSEYVDILSGLDPNDTSAMEKADNITVEKCVIWPENFKLSDVGAGVPMQLATLISEFSGFLNQGEPLPEPEEL